MGSARQRLARDLAAGLLCTDPDPAARPCRTCAACRKLEHGNHPDLHLLEPEGAGQQIRVAQVQALAADLSLLPLEGRYRVAIIEHANRLNQDAQNALLKTLEEPPARVCLILAADDSTTLLPTVEQPLREAAAGTSGFGHGCRDARRGRSGRSRPGRYAGPARRWPAGSRSGTGAITGGGAGPGPAVEDAARPVERRSAAPAGRAGRPASPTARCSRQRPPVRWEPGRRPSERKLARNARVGLQGPLPSAAARVVRVPPSVARRSHRS